MQGFLSAPSAGRRLRRYRSLAHFAMVMLCSVPAALLAPAAAETPGPLRIEITARRFAFQPAEITVKKGQAVILVLQSGDVTHGLRIRELNIDVKIKKGANTEAQFTPEKTGTFVVHCSVFCGSGHGRMMLTIHVVE